MLNVYLPYCLYATIFIVHSACCSCYVSNPLLSPLAMPSGHMRPRVLNGSSTPPPHAHLKSGLLLKVLRRRTYYELLLTHTGRSHAAPCTAPRGSFTTTSHQQSPPHPALHHRTRPPVHTSSLVSDHTRVSHAHARPLHPAALAFVPYGIVLVRVRVRSTGFCAIWDCFSSSSSSSPPLGFLP